MKKVMRSVLEFAIEQNTNSYIDKQRVFTYL